MDWEYYIDNDLSNSLVRSTAFYLTFRLWYKNVNVTLFLNREGRIKY